MESKNQLTHLDKNLQPGMVDVTSKASTERLATAVGRINISQESMFEISKENFETKKGSITQTAIIAGTMAVKNTWNTIPLCHQIPISSCRINIVADENGFDVSCQVKTTGQTGVEMEALHGVSTACLTIYDMCKAISHDMSIDNIHLVSKSGGKIKYEKQS